MREKKILVSIIITNYNYGEYLAQAIDSALGQSYSPVEIIVVDDGSTDNSRDIIANFGNRIIPVMLGKNKGFTTALQTGFDTSKGEIICFLDADDIFFPNKVTNVVKAMSSDNCANVGWCLNKNLLVEDKDVNNKLNELENTSFKNLSIETSEIVDFRKWMQKGKFPPFGVPSSSGLSFHRSLMKKLLPLPKGNRYVDDLYLKFTAIALEKGCVIKGNLGIFRLHENSLYTTQPLNKKYQRGILMDINSAYLIRFRFSELWRLADKFLCRGIGAALKIGYSDHEIKKTLHDYLANISLIEKITLVHKILYYRFKFWASIY
jgi:glycosyltransferase involved in cell wall biosynthesis